MPYKSTLPWRKFPRDTLHNPSLLFIINRMKEEHRQAVFTVFLGLYCEADDDGFVDISDGEFFADQCLTDADTLKLILQHFEKRHLIEKVAKDVPIYRIVDWLSPYPQGGGGKTAAERQKEYRERKKEEAQTHEETPAAPPVGEPAAPATPAESENSAKAQGGAVQTSDDTAEQDVFDAQMSEDICALIKKGEDLTDDELISQIRFYKSARKNGVSREEAQEAAERFCSAPERSEKTESERTDAAADADSAEPAEKSVMPPVTGGITEHNALCNDCNALHNGRNALQPKKKREIETEKERERQKEIERTRKTQKESEKVRKRRKKRGANKKKPKKRIQNRGTPYKNRYRKVITMMYNTLKE